VSVNRREFLQASAGLVVGLYVAPRAGRLWAAPPPGAAPALPAANAFLRVAPDDTVTVLLAHSEMGQGVWTTLPMLVAEELGCDWAKVRVEHAPAAPAYAHTAMGMQMTGGSTSTWSELVRYRQVGALARELLVRAAAAEWKLDPGACHVENGFVVAGGKRLSFGKLAEAAQKLAPPAQVKLKDPKEWKLLGKPMKRLDSAAKVTGQAQFGMDVRLPGMLTALVLRAPTFGGTVKAVRSDKASAVPGVKKVVQVPSGVAVVAEHFWAAKLGRDALEVDWAPAPGEPLETDKQREAYRALARTPGTKVTAAGDVDAALAAAKTVLEAEYELPYLAHAPMEPLSCTVKLGADQCEIWTGTQFQTMEQMTAAKIAGLKPEQVLLHTQFLGGGFGRRATPTCDFVSEAVQVAKAFGGAAPVKTVWTREDDIRGGYYRPMFAHRVRAALGQDGLPAAWQQTLVGQSILAGTPFEPMMVKNGIDGVSVEGASDSPYLTHVPNHRVELHSPKTPVPVLWWRSVGHTHTAFVKETFIDELAHAAGQDPLAYRRALLGGHARARGVLDLAAQKAHWGKPLPPGHFQGLAVHESFGSHVAEVAEVSVDGGKIRVHRVVCAIDCGVVVNPAGVRAQLESAVVFGLSAALYGELTFKEGRVEQSNFHDYPVLRLFEMPQVDVYLLESGNDPGGAGEPGTPPIAPAVANAVFAATGKRFRRLPLRLEAA
jgi:isoquinoline 1-oxidoreductase beta subunit